MPESFSQAELIQSVDLLRITIPRMNNLPVPLTPENYAVWYEYSQGTTLELNSEIDDHLNAGKTFTREYNRYLYETFIVKDTQKVIEVMQTATKVVIESLVKKIQGMSNGAVKFSGALTECQELLQGNPDVNQINSIVTRVLEETEHINFTNHEMISNLTSMEAEMLSLRSQMDELVKAAHSDQLTRVANRRGFDQRLFELFEAFEQQGKIFSVILIDIDHFKRFNDTYGHAVGDKVLTYVASSLKACVRENDLVARYGGEEFVILLEENNYEAAVSLADTIRQRVAKRKLTSNSTSEEIGSVTISAGVSIIVPQDTSVSLLDRADRALYFAKNNGRNQVCGEAQIN